MAKRRGYDFSSGVRGRFHGKPFKVHLASTTRIEQLADLARELFIEIFEMSCDDCLVTDESDVDFFITEETPDDYEERFRARYGFALEDVTSGLLIDVLCRISADRRTTRAPN